MKSSRNQAFTLIELLVVISIIAILASIAVPVFGEVLTRGQQTKALANAKQIALACRLFADDYNGLYPSKTLDANEKMTTSDVTTSNEAFSQIVPTYISNKQLFYVPKSKFTPQPPDDKITAGNALAKGENHWAYVLNLTTTSPAQWPLMADGFKDPTSHTYSTSETEEGGVWKGKKAIVIRADCSGDILKAKTKDQRIPGNPDGDDLFDNSGKANWMGADNKVVNPSK